MSDSRGRDLLRETGREIVGTVEDIARREVRAFRHELERPWREGRQGGPAEVGRWLGLGLAAAAILAGVAMAVYAERPWE